MGSESPLSILFFPLMAHGHMIPMVDMAKLFSSRGVHCTIVTTPVNEPFILKSITKVQPPGLQIDVKTIPFPSVEVGLPEGCENLNMIPGPDLFIAFFTAIVMLKEPFEKLLEVHKPDCLVSDMFFPWSNDLASKIGIPRIVFHGTSYFALCAGEVLHLHKPYLSVESDDEPFVLPGFPDEIKLTRSQLPLDIMQNKESVLTQLLDQCREEDAKSYGVLVNSFHELEPRYADHYKNVLGHRAWEIGPLSLCNMNVEEKGMRGKDASIGENECLKWLDSKRPESVVYVCFGSTCKFSDDQLAEIASGLEESGHNFIWVIRRLSDSDEEDFLPKGFEERVNDKALLIRGWAPQMLILDHPSVGGFVSHCGWNSTLEGISAGLPIVTWPVFAEQFYNEKLVTEVLKIGVSVGARKWGRFDGGNVGKGAIEKAVREVMEGEERRGRARELAKMAKRAVEKDGSSYISLDKLLQELRSKKA